MIRSIVLAISIAGGLTTALQAQGAPSTVRFGIMVGRDGAAFGPGLLAEVNPLPWLGLYGFAGRSSVGGYSSAGGVVANLSDRTLGFGVTGRFLKMHRFTLGGFGQAAYYGSHVTATYPDGFGGTGQYTDSQRRPLVTIGPQIEYRVALFTVFVRPGKDFGDNFAAQSAGGFSVNGGVLVGGTDIVRGVGKGFRKLFQ